MIYFATSLSDTKAFIFTSTCLHNSLVGHITKPNKSSLSDSFADNIEFNIGKLYAYVFPLPVSAAANIFFLSLKIASKQKCWIFVGDMKFFLNKIIIRFHLRY